MITKILQYLKPSFEGIDGKLSYRRASQFVFIVLLSFMVLTGKTETQYQFYTLVALIVAFLLLASIITSQQIIEAIKSLAEKRKECD